MGKRKKTDLAQYGEAGWIAFLFVGGIVLGVLAIIAAGWIGHG